MHFDFFPAKKSQFWHRNKNWHFFQASQECVVFVPKNGPLTHCVFEQSVRRKSNFALIEIFFFFAGRVSLTDEASDEELTKGLYHVEGDCTGLVRNPVPQVKKLLKIALESSNYATKHAKFTFLRKCAQITKNIFNCTKKLGRFSTTVFFHENCGNSIKLRNNFLIKLPFHSHFCITQCAKGPFLGPKTTNSSKLEKWSISISVSKLTFF